MKVPIYQGNKGNMRVTLYHRPDRDQRGDTEDGVQGFCFEADFMRKDLNPTLGFADMVDAIALMKEVHKKSVEYAFRHSRPN